MPSAYKALRDKMLRKAFLFRSLRSFRGGGSRCYAGATAEGIPQKKPRRPCQGVGLDHDDCPPRALNGSTVGTLLAMASILRLLT